MKKIKEIMFIIFSTLLLLSCTAADIDKFVNSLTDTEYASNPDKFREYFFKNIDTRDRLMRWYETSDEVDEKEYDNKVNNMLNSNKTGVITIKDKNGNIKLKLNISKGKIVEETYIDSLGNIVTIKNKEITLYYRTGQKLASERDSELTLDNSSRYDIFLGTYSVWDDPERMIFYYENGGVAMEINRDTGRTLIYHKDGRPFFEERKEWNNGEFKRY